MTKGEPASYILYTILLKSITTTLQNKAPQCPADISQTFVTSRHFLEERVTLHLTSPWERHSSNGKEIMSDSIYPKATVSNPDVAPISFYRSHSALQSLHHSRSTSKMLHWILLYFLVNPYELNWLPWRHLFYPVPLLCSLSDGKPSGFVCSDNTAYDKPPVHLDSYTLTYHFLYSDHLYQEETQ